MDTCILVISADETCPAPQTEEHVAVLQIVGSSEDHFSDGIVVQNKVDLVSPDRIAKSREEIALFTEGTVFQQLPVIPTSAQMQLNVHHVLKFIYEYASSFRDHKIQRVEAKKTSSLPKGIIVRTFDINKPGSEKVSGAVIGGSIVKGTFVLGDDIVIVPLGVEAKIVSMKTDVISLQKAHVGGLIALQTDINPSYCNSLTGCAFVKKEDFKVDRLLPVGHQLKMKYRLLKSCSLQELKKDDRLTISYGGFHVDVIVVKSPKDKSRKVVSICKPLYVFPDENVEFTMVFNKRLIGCGRFTEYIIKEEDKDAETTTSSVVPFEPYDTLLNEFQESLKEWKELSVQKMRVPVPKTVFKNTITTVINFESICNCLVVSPEELGGFICNELGMKSWSVNGSKQLLLKGRTNERRVISVIHNYIVEKRCLLCRQTTIKIVRNMGVKQKVCTNCTWRGT